jgi:hypothetical protein
VTVECHLRVDSTHWWALIERSHVACAVIAEMLSGAHVRPGDDLMRSI